MSDRLARLRTHVADLNAAGVRTTTFFALVAESLRQTAELPRPIRRAQAFAHLLDRAPQVVLPDELLVGSILGIWPVAESVLDDQTCRDEAVEVLDGYQRRGLTEERPGDRRFVVVARDGYHANIPYGRLQQVTAEMRERFGGPGGLNHVEIARELERHFVFDYGDDQRIVRELPWAAANHIDLNYPRLLRLGLTGLRDEARERLNAAAEAEKSVFFQSCLIAAEAAIGFVLRYAETLEGLARDESGSADRRAELVEMADVCRRIAGAPPKTFREAIQLVWLVHIMGCLAEGSALSLARFDQYLHPFYTADVSAGRLTRDQARELVGCLWLKVNEPHMRIVQSVCLAGQTPDGSDAANELTDLCLEVCAELKQPYPNVSVRLGRQSPEWLYDRVVETMRVGIGHPMVLNDEVWVPNLERQGFPAHDARDYYNMGCAEILIQGGRAHWGPGGGVIHFPGVIELVLRNGRANLAGDAGIPTGEPDDFQTFEQFFDAYLAQIRHLIAQVPSASAVRERSRRETWCDPFGSLLLDDCLAKGLDMYRGGARYGPVRPVTGFGLGTAVDSLGAIRRFVFDERRLTLGELAGVLEEDFAGREDLRRRLESCDAGWGNDLDDIDRIARRIFDVYADATHALNEGAEYGVYATNLFSYTGHVYRGEVVGATPNGRHARAPLSDAMGPTQGKDIRGPTALLNSILSLDSTKITGGAALNLKMAASVVADARGADARKAMVKSYLARGGAQLQVNLVDPAELEDARDHPERHGDLIVRVAGFSEYFTSLDRTLQDEIIRRTAHAEAPGLKTR